MSDGAGEQPGGDGAASPAFLATARRLAAIRDALGEGALRLAYHAAVPVAVDAELLNLLRVNFFLDDPPDVLPFEAEAELLLSPLFREIGEGLYEIDPGLRNLLLSGLHTRYGDERVGRVSALLAQYTDTGAWRSLPELELAQRLTALSFLDPAGAQRWLDAREASAARSPAPGDDGPGREWYVAMRRRVAENSAITTIDAEIRYAGEALLRLLAYGDVSARRSVIGGLEALAGLPDTDADEVVNVLCRFIQEWDGRSPGPSKRVTPDVQAALRLIGSVPHIEFRLTGVVLTGANLAGLDFSYAIFDRVTLTELDARGIDLSYAQFTGVVLADASLDGALLDEAFLEFHSLRRVSLNGVSPDGATLVAGTFEDVTGSRADGAPVQIHLAGSSADLAAEGEPAAVTSGAPVDEAAMLSAARLAQDGEQWQQARDIYRAILDATGPGGVRNPDVRQGLVRCYFQLGQPDEAVRLLRDALAVYAAPGDPHPDFVVAAYVRAELGGALLRMGLPDEALAELSGAVTAARVTGDRLHEARAEASLAAALVEAGRRDEAEEHYRLALDYYVGQRGTRGEEAAVLSSLAGLLVRLGRSQEAADYAVTGAVAFRDAADHYSEVTLLRRIADACAGAGIHDTAITLYEMAFQASSESVGADDPQTKEIARALAVEWAGQGEALSAQGHYSEAVADFHTAIDYDGGFAAPHAGWGIALLRQGRYEGALSAFTTALRLDPGDARAHRGFGEACQRSGRYARAAGSLKSGSVSATGFWTAPRTFVTAAHAVQAGVPAAVATLTNAGDIVVAAQVRQQDATRDVAVLTVASDVPGLGSWLTLFAASGSMALAERVEVLTPMDPIAGMWAGLAEFRGRPVGRVSCEARLPQGLSGAPVIRLRDGAVVGMVVGQRTGEDAELLAVRAEDIVDVLGTDAAVTLIDDAAPTEAESRGTPLPRGGLGEQLLRGRLRGAPGPLNVGFGPGDTVVVVDQDAAVHRWRIADQAELGAVPGGERARDGIRVAIATTEPAIAFAHSRKLTVARLEDGTYRVAAEVPLGRDEFIVPGGGERFATYTGKRVAVRDFRDGAILWAYPCPPQLATVTTDPTGAVVATADGRLGANGNQVTAGAQDRTRRLNGFTLANVPLVGAGCVLGLSPGGELLAAASLREVALTRPHTGEVAFRRPLRGIREEMVPALGTRPQRLIPTPEGTILWLRGRRVAVIREADDEPRYLPQDGHVDDIAFDYARSRLATVSSDGLVTVWRWL